MKSFENNAEQALSILNINYRSLSCKNGTIYFCITSAGFRFDLWVNNNGNVRIWKLLPDVPDRAKNIAYTYKNPKYPHAAVAIRYSSDMEITFYIQNRISQNDIEAKHQLCRMIRGYEQLFNHTILKT